MVENVFKRPVDYFAERKAGITVREVAQQPRLWRELAGDLWEQREQITAFMQKMAGVKDLRIVFTGAGSSAFIGESMQMMLAREFGIKSEAVATTDIVSAPDCVLYDVPTLLVSYSRSGESPESAAALEYAGKKVSQLYNLVIVCKKNSSLANYAAHETDTLVLCMPPESSDEGFAMTSSVSCMALATHAVFGWQKLEERLAYIKGLADSVEAEMPQMDEKAREIAEFSYKRLIYLGSGGLKGLAHEGSVKSLELTNGAVNASFETSMGFRHGPKTVVSPTTLTVHFISPDAFTCQYDMDLVREMLPQRKGNRLVLVAPDSLQAAEADYVVGYSLPEDGFAEMSAYIKGLVFMQMLSVEKSLSLGVPTDNPSVNGEVNRVVQGVHIYEL